MLRADHIKLPIEFALQHDASLAKAIEAVRRIAVETLEAFHVTLTDDIMTVTVTGMDAAKITIRLTLWVPVQDKDHIEDTVRRRLLDTLNTPELMLA